MRLLGAASLFALAGSLSTQAGTLSYDFSSDPSAGTPPIVVGGNNPDFYVASGGNPGGFLAITYPIDGQKTTVVFPDTDPGKVVTAFEFSCDLRVGNPEGARAADGFSISFARDGDPILEDANSDNFGGNCCAETGTRTGIAVSFDTWSGNTFPDDPNDTTDIEGFIIRVDNVTVQKVALPTRNGLADDITSLQTGPRDAAFWDNPDHDIHDPASWSGLAWKPFSISLTADGKLTVKWKGNTVLNNFQTAYFPTSGRLVFSGRTGGENEHTHVDNIQLTTTAASCAAVPTVPGNVRVTQVGTRRAVVAWDASTMAGDPTGGIAYELENNGVAIPGQILGLSYELTGLNPSGANTFKIRAKNVCAQASEFATLTVTTVAEVDSPGTLLAQVYRTATDGTAFGGATLGDIDTVLADAKYPNSPDSIFYVNGFQFGEPTFGNTYGENHLTRIAGTFVAPKSGSFRFFVRSDDASRLYVKAGTAIPNPASDTIIAQEAGCCGPFEEPGNGDNGDGTFPTSEPMALTAGSTYGVLFLVKEGGGGDWGQVGWREEGTTTVYPLVGPIIPGKGDAVGANVSITNQPASVSVAGYLATTFTVGADASSPYGKPAAYQWYKNGAAIIGANTASYNIPVVQPTDNAAKYKVAVSVNGKSVESSEATLTVTADQPATIVSLTGSDTLNRATVKFNQPVAAASATTAANYTFDKGLTVSSATAVDAFTVRLTTGTQTSGTAYKLTVNGVQNLGGKPTANVTADFTAWDLVAGVVRADQFTGLAGAGLGDMDTAIADPKYPDSPDVVRFLTNGLTFGEPAFGDTWGENHLVAMKGILKPTETASYRFFVRSDDASRLFINTSGAALPDAKTATPIAIEAGCCGPFEEVGAGDNGDGTFPTSEPIALTSGQSYGVLYLVKEGGGGDWGQVAWRKSTDTTSASTLTPIKSAIYWFGPAATTTPPTNGAPTLSVSRNTAGAVVLTFTGSLESRDSLTTGAWAAVAGATSPFTVTPSVPVRFWRARNN